MSHSSIKNVNMFIPGFAEALLNFKNQHWQAVDQK